jgi:hypothetical protein
MASLHFVPFEKEMIEFIVVCSAMQPVKKSAAAAVPLAGGPLWLISYFLFTIDTSTLRGVRGVSRDQLN